MQACKHASVICGTRCGTCLIRSATERALAWGERYIPRRGKPLFYGKREIALSVLIYV